ncbi:hypothetical protein TetV_266 [Tetraselmis virus 1]|uniref:Uncharacterized protein n=1 Tax=Tetraselmis virus 1 TaxID=2060617 RepID=A0A2P0VN85_9VIRU|nr:hypothetical protein QJ968_gp266 [Tetraselmis virus 1]AUF82358.1 hypothetical protein TetV_266 [Tetraselmis virus 1]
MYSTLKNSKWVKRLCSVEKYDYILAKDVIYNGNNVSRQFKGFNTYNSYINCIIESNETQHLYEVIKHGTDTPVWFYADHDCKKSTAHKEWTNEEFTMEILKLYSNYFRISSNCIQISTSHRSDKHSVHVKIDIDLKKGALEAKEHAYNIYLLTYLFEPDLVPDMSVYSISNQQFRAIGSKKISCSEGKKLPWRLCSTFWKDHIIRRNPEDIRPLVVIDCLPVKVPTTWENSYEKTDSRELHELIRDVLENSGIGNNLGDRFNCRTCKIGDVKKSEERITFWINGSKKTGNSEVICPFANRVHTGNRLSFTIEKADQETGEGCIYINCPSKDCKGKYKRLLYNMGEFSRKRLRAS